MNQSLTALMTKLTWQQNELSMHLRAVQQELTQLEKRIQDVEQQINASHLSPFMINPEFEINRLNFIAQQQEKKYALRMDLNNQKDLENKLTAKLQRTKTEISMLEKYQEKKQREAKLQQQKIQENAIEEWVLHQRDNA